VYWPDTINSANSKCDRIRKPDVIAAYNHEVLKKGISEKAETIRITCGNSE